MTRKYESYVMAALLICPAALAQTPIDFSYAGYGGGGVSAALAPALISVSPTGSDDSGMLGIAVEQVSMSPLRADGLRGAVLLLPGRYLVGGQLTIRASGVVFRG